LQRTRKERSVRPRISAGKSSAKARTSQSEQQTPIKPQEEGTTLLHLRRPGTWWSEAVEDEGMLKVPAYNSKKEAFHHANSQCGLGLRIAPHNRVSGTGNKPLCKNCKKLNDQDAVNWGSVVTA